MSDGEKSSSDTTPSDTVSKSSGRPEKIGPYRILDTLGEGGMSVVYLAEQSKPVKRRVALKILKAGMDSKQVVARFESERQALAVLDHPNIAKIFDGGIAESGRPYFVMEQVKGAPITDYCDDQRLNNEDRLKIFIKVCSAVQHAHVKGLIHRDLKPSNVLVSVVDGEPQPKIIDFGIAKATSVTLTEATLYTRVGQIIGTPQYMSPEQANITGLDVDTRADIYSLGVVLYELLVGTVPLDLQAIGDHAMQVALHEKDPPKPSTRFTELGDTQDEIARARSTERDRLRQQLRGDLDWIVMRAIEKDRTRRYETANALAMECRRFLKHEPVLARPPSPTYLLGRFVKRNRRIVVAGSIAIIAVIAGATVATLGFIRATEAERIAVQEAATASETTDFLIELFQVSNPFSFSPVSHKSGEDITAREILDMGAERIARKLEDQPEVRAGLMTSIGRVFMGLGLPDRAHPLITEGLEIRRNIYAPEHVAIGDSLMALGMYNLLKGDFEQAALAQEEAIAIYENAWGKDVPGLAWMLSRHAVTLANKGDLNAALEYQLRALAILRAETNPDLSVMGQALNNLGYVQNSLTFHEDAVRSFEEAVAVLAETESRGLYSRALANLAASYMQMGRLAESRGLQEEALAIKRDWFGPDHIETGYSVANLSFLYQFAGDYENSIALKREAIEIFSAKLGENHPNIGIILGGLGWNLSLQGKYAEAESTLFDALERLRLSMGTDSLQEPSIINSIGEMYAAQGKYAEAEAKFRDSIRIVNKAGITHAQTGRALAGIANLPTSTLSVEERLKYFEEALHTLEKTEGLGTPDAAVTQMNFATLLLQQGDEERARNLFVTGLRSLGAALPEDNTRFVEQAKRYEDLFGESPP